MSENDKNKSAAAEAPKDGAKDAKKDKKDLQAKEEELV